MNVNDNGYLHVGRSSLTATSPPPKLSQSLAGQVAYHFPKAKYEVLYFGER